ncbi:hypothetical protein LR948_18475 [Roseivivax sp. GX 12232]|uniref:hypothetical protein n=1 Tax=Roseivivax sp. GX 12232 TaxID=2900547 RepID=UPI001E413491|nr:hypothetical protein [Roseivivax sp. GX 12232]MCE0507348.1 hypothetical protein [Roseivivax sp. GX 12232]
MLRDAMDGRFGEAAAQRRIDLRTAAQGRLRHDAVLRYLGILPQNRMTVSNRFAEVPKSHCAGSLRNFLCGATNLQIASQLLIGSFVGRTTKSVGATTTPLAFSTLATGRD